MQKGGKHLSFGCRHIETVHRNRNKVPERPTGIPSVYSTAFAHNILMPKYSKHDQSGNATHSNIKAYIHIYVCFLYIKQNRGRKTHTT